MKQFVLRTPRFILFHSFRLLLFKHFPSIHIFCTGGSSFKKLFKNANMNSQCEKNRQTKKKIQFAIRRSANSVRKYDMKRTTLGKRTHQRRKHMLDIILRLENFHFHCDGIAGVGRDTHAVAVVPLPLQWPKQTMKNDWKIATVYNGDTVACPSAESVLGSRY